MEDSVFTPNLGVMLHPSPNRGTRVERFPRLSSWHAFSPPTITWVRQRVVLDLADPAVSRRPDSPVTIDALFPVRAIGADAAEMPTYAYILGFPYCNILGLSPQLLDRFMLCLTPETVFVLSRPQGDDATARDAT